MKVKKASGMTTVFGVVFSLAGILLIIVGICIFAADKKFEKNAEKTSAVITDIDTYRTRTGTGKNRRTRTDHDVFVKYEVDGKVYERQLNYYTSGMYTGQTIEIMYNPENPGEIRAGNSFVMLLILCGMGVIFAAAGVPFLVLSAKGGSKKRLKENGERMTGTVTNVITVTNIRINGNHPYKLECEVIDSYTGEKYLYSSDSVMNDLSLYIGSTIDVYVDPNDKSRSYVDLESLGAVSVDGNAVHDYR